MIKQTIILVSYLMVSISIGITVTFTADKLGNVAQEEKIRKVVKSEIRNAIDSFKESSHDATSDEVINFIKSLSTKAMKDRIIAIDPAKEDKPKSNEFKFLFKFTEREKSIDLYLKNSFLEDELAILGAIEQIYGIVTTLVIFSFIVLYTQKKKQAETKHRELKKALQEHEALALLGRMTAALAHELKTPVATISNLIQALPSRISDEYFKERFITLTREELNRAQQLIDNLLLYGKNIEIINEEWILFGRLVKEMADKNDIKIISCPKLMLYGDKFYIGLLFENLFRNSQKAGANEIRIRADAASLNNGSHVEIYFEDNGNGFPEDYDLSELIMPFVTTYSSGAGLGLYLSKKIISAHHGKIDLYRLEKGAGVKISIPQKRIRPDE